jgi:hypothetical protein
MVHPEGDVPQLNPVLLGQLLLYVFAFEACVWVHVSLTAVIAREDEPNAGRANLQVKLNVTVSRIIWGKSINGKAVATGVEYINAAGTKATVVRTSPVVYIVRLTRRIY